VFAVLALVFVVLPIVEIYVAIQVSHHIGVANTILALLIFSFVGAWLAKRAGFGVIARMRSQLERGVLPGNEIVDGVLVFAAGVLLLVPGFVTGILGLVLLLPPVRHLVRAGIVRSLRKRVTRYTIIGPTGPMGRSGPTGSGGSTGPSGPTAPRPPIGPGNIVDV
jgi:UPF0716 protein FxsA